MTRTMALFTGILLAGCSGHADDRRQAAPRVDRTPAVARQGLPAEVIAFQKRRDSCDELRGEEPYDSARADQLARAQKAACTGTDKALAALKARYAGDTAVGAALAKYDATVE